MPRRSRTLLLTVMLAAALWPASAEAESVMAGSISGQVLFRATHRGVTGATVVARSAALDGGQTTVVTNPDGTFELTALPDGTYDVTFKFAEPEGSEDYEAGGRVLDVVAEGNKIIDDLDIMVARDGKVQSALGVTIPNVTVADGELNISFEASAGEPVLSGLVVRRIASAQRERPLVWSDEFDYEGAPDSSKWNIERWPAGKVNTEGSICRIPEP